jgi:serine/threonine protein kinase
VKLPFQLGRYTLVHRIGVGAFGQVYRAEVRGDMGFVSDFAVKVLDSNVVADNPNVARQLGDEARILSQLDHPNIVKVVDFKHIEHSLLGNVYFMVMECVRGTDVATILRRRRGQQEQIPATAVLHMGLMVSDALAHAHTLATRDGNSLCIVHRDLKPQNLMVNFRGQVKVLDFGIAKATEDHRLASRTQEGQTKGTVFYMSPEQLSGDALDGRSDIYSLGTILFEMLLGTRLIDVEVSTAAELVRAMHTAFEMDIEERLTVLRAHLEQGNSGDLSSEAIEGWLGLLRAALQKDCTYRPDSAATFSQQLEKLRNLHPPAETRDFWAQEVEAAASDQQVSYDSKAQALNRPAEEVPRDRSAGGSGTHEFFGMETGALADDDGRASGQRPQPETVPLTRGMAVVTGTVRSFGSDIIQRLGPPSASQPAIQAVTIPPGDVTLPYVPNPGRGPQTMDLPAHEGGRGTGDDLGSVRDPSDTDTAPSMAPLSAEDAAEFEDTVTDTRVVTRSGTHKQQRRHKSARSTRRPLLVGASTGVMSALLVFAVVALVTWLGQSNDDEIVEDAAVAIQTNSAEIKIVAEDPRTTTIPLEGQAADGSAGASAAPGLDENADGDSPEPSAGDDAASEAGADPATTTSPASKAASSPAPAGDKASTAAGRGRPDSPAAVLDRKAARASPQSQRSSPVVAARRPGKGATVAKGSTAAAAKAASSEAATDGSTDQANMGFVRLVAKPRCRVLRYDCPCPWAKGGRPPDNGIALGTTDETRKGVWLPAGTHRIRFICDDPAECANWKHTTGGKTITVKPGKDNKPFKVDFYDVNGVSD